MALAGIAPPRGISCTAGGGSIEIAAFFVSGISADRGSSIQMARRRPTTET